MDFKFLDGKLKEEIKNYIDDNSDKTNEIIFYFAEKGDLEIIKYLLEEKKLNVNAKELLRKTILFYACRSGNIELVKYLVEQGGDVNAECEGETLLFNACRSGNLELVKYLVEEKKLNVNAKILYGNLERQTILFIACANGNLELVKYLVEEKIMNVNAKDKYGQNVLLFACQSRNIDIVKYLIRHGADINDEQTLLLWTKKYSLDTEIIDYLISTIELLDIIDFLEKKLNNNENPEDFIYYWNKKRKNIVLNNQEYILQKKQISIKEQLNNWLRIALNKLGKNKTYQIDFLLKYGAERKIIYEEILNSIKNPNFDKFSFIVKKFQDIFDDIKQKEDYQIIVYEQLNNWLEQKYCEEDYNKEDINFLINLGAKKEKILIESIKQQDFVVFKKLVKEDKTLFERLRKNDEFNNELEKQLDIWLQEQYFTKSEFYKIRTYNEENIKFLVNLGAKKEKILIESIKQQDFVVFKKLVKEDYKLLLKIREKEELNIKLQSFIDKYLYDNLNIIEEETFLFLLNCGFDENINKIINEIIKNSIENHNFLIFFKVYKLIEKFKIGILTNDWNSVCISNYNKFIYIKDLLKQLNKYIVEKDFSKFYKLLTMNKDYFLSSEQYNSFSMLYLYVLENLEKFELIRVYNNIDEFIQNLMDTNVVEEKDFLNIVHNLWDKELIKILLQEHYNGFKNFYLLNNRDYYNNYKYKKFLFISEPRKKCIHWPCKRIKIFMEVCEDNLSWSDGLYCKFCHYYYDNEDDYYNDDYHDVVCYDEYDNIYYHRDDDDFNIKEYLEEHINGEKINIIPKYNRKDIIIGKIEVERFERKREREKLEIMFNRFEMNYKKCLELLMK